MGPQSEEKVSEERESSVMSSVEKEDNHEGTQKNIRRTMSTRPVRHRKRSKGGEAMTGIVKWVGSAEGLHGLRVLVVTIALGVIAVIPSTAGFFYREKGLWGLIMAQTILVPYSGDFVAGFVLRGTGTVVGGIVGMMAWYIGAGDGPDNPYGIAAIMVPVIVVFMWLRLFLLAIWTQAIIMTVATCYLVVGYSWNDMHTPTYGNPGVGYTIFWERVLLVLMGLCAAVVVTFLPRPPSANRHHRKVLAQTVGVTQNRYSLLTSESQRSENIDIQTIAKKVSIDVGTVLLETQASIPSTRLEFTSSHIDTRALETVCRLCVDLNTSITELLLYVSQLHGHFAERFQRMTGIHDDDLATAVAATLTLVRQSLLAGTPLPRMRPLLTTAHTIRSGLFESAEGQEQSIAAMGELGFAALADDGARKYCSAVAGFVRFLAAIDKLADALTAAVGEYDTLEADP